MFMRFLKGFVFAFVAAIAVQNSYAGGDAQAG